MAEYPLRGRLTLLQPGLCTLLIDPARPSRRSLGVPVGGPADRWSMALGNALVDNPPETPALEVALLGPTLQADVPLACVVFGAPFDLCIDQRSMASGRTFTLHPGETLSIFGTATGMRAYLCVHGGLEGNFAGSEPLRVGTQLGCRGATIAGRSLAEEAESLRPRRLRVLPGPQADWFDQRVFHEHTFFVTPASNRMGLRLSGPRLTVPARELVSEPVCPGTIQVTREGQCIILGCDGQTIGGYPRIAQVISADLDRLGQLSPGNTVAFESVTLDRAEVLFYEREQALQTWQMRLQLSPIAKPISVE